MNEVVIDDKKYVSSKQAAEMTGYAKDYVGQLCREGRVPARLIGRSWYVLASAIQDHKFGADEPKRAPAEEKKSGDMVVISKTWEAPQYKPEETNYFPSINKLAPKEPSQKSLEIDEAPKEEIQHQTMQTMHEAWKEWFNHKKEAPVAVETEVPQESEDFVEEKFPAETVPIRSVPTLGRVSDAAQGIEVRVVPQTKTARVGDTANTRQSKVIQPLLFITTIIAVFLAILGTDFGRNVVSEESALARLAGISSINK